MRPKKPGLTRVAYSTSFSEGFRGDEHFSVLASIQRNLTRSDRPRIRTRGRPQFSSSYSARSIWLSSRIAPLETTVSPGAIPLKTTTRCSRTAPAITSRRTKRPAAFLT